ncbi:hypothetical protein [Tepidibacter sp. Z1-5]|uniref:hypothetical protein n=1 Tax=Tepidibacter sp. Z1-5 TaxID=3134138 RepID=UPI0030C62AA2
MEKLIFNNKEFVYYEYEYENEFEEDVVENSKKIFGNQSIYIDIKKRIGQDKILSIPDGYLLDFSFINQPKLYIIENELAVHDPYRHIGQQILKFAISYKASGRKIKKILLEEIQKQEEDLKLVEEVIRKSGYRNIDNLIEEIVFDREVGCIVVIDKNSDELENVLSQLTMKTDIIQFQTFINDKDEIINKFEPFQGDIKVDLDIKDELSVEELDTIIVPAREDGFNEVFLGEDCWYSIRMSSSMINRVKYIAAYQTSPISAITHYAQISKIEKYDNTNKYIVYFKDSAKEIKHIKLPKDNPRLAPQAPRYTNFNKMIKAKTLEDIF